jgi:hypothetical protein
MKSEKVVTKGEFAAMLGVALSTVSTWIARGQLTAPALSSDGRIDVVLGKKQLAERIDLAKSRGRSPAGLFAKIDKPAPAPAPLPGRLGIGRIAAYGERITVSRGDLLQLELDRQELLRLFESGRLVKVSDADRALSRDLADLIGAVDGELAEWVRTSRGAASCEEAVRALGERCARLRNSSSK